MDANYVQLHNVAAYGDWSTLKSLLDSDPDLITAPITEWKANVIHVAAGLGRDAVFVREVMDYMDQRGISVDGKDNKEQNALHYAARSGNTEAAKLLVEKDPTLTQQQSSFGFIPLQVAIGFGHHKTASNLMSVTQSQDTSSMVNAQQVGKKDLVKDEIYVELYKATIFGDWSILKHILDSDPDLLSAPITEWNANVIHVAAASGREAAFLRELIHYMGQRGVSVGGKDNKGQNALHYAAQIGNTEAAQLLVEKDPTLTQQKSSFGFNPLEVAIGFGHVETARHLQQ